MIISTLKQKSQAFKDNMRSILDAANAPEEVKIDFLRSLPTIIKLDNFINNLPASPDRDLTSDEEMQLGDSLGSCDGFRLVSDHERNFESSLMREIFFSDFSADESSPDLDYSRSVYWFHMLEAVKILKNAGKLTESYRDSLVHHGKPVLLAKLLADIKYLLDDALLNYLVKIELYEHDSFMDTFKHLIALDVPQPLIISYFETCGLSKLTVSTMLTLKNNDLLRDDAAFINAVKEAIEDGSDMTKFIEIVKTTGKLPHRLTMGDVEKVFQLLSGYPPRFVAEMNGGQAQQSSAEVTVLAPDKSSAPSPSSSW